jgi:hypothetical protein
MGDEQALRRYIETARAWAEHGDQPSVANRLFDENHQLYKSLRSSEEGRRGIEELLDDDSTGVRCLAAADTLTWAPELALPVLESIERGPGLAAVTAKYTLREFWAGRLNLDW